MHTTARKQQEYNHRNALSNNTYTHCSIAANNMDWHDNCIFFVSPKSLRCHCLPCFSSRCLCASLALSYCLILHFDWSVCWSSISTSDINFFATFRLLCGRLFIITTFRHDHLKHHSHIHNPDRENISTQQQQQQQQQQTPLRQTIPCTQANTRHPTTDIIHCSRCTFSPLPSF